MHQSVSSERVARIRVIDSYMMSIECGAVLRPMTLSMAEARYDFSIQYFFLKKKLTYLYSKTTSLKAILV